jgi:hypothetical protein
VSIYRSYFQKNSTLIQNNNLNVSQNPVGEISYGTANKTVSRIIFKVDLQDLTDKIVSEGINKNSIISHKLVLTNTIAQRPDLLGGLSYSSSIERASSFSLDLFTLTEDWDEGAGYEFQFNDDALIMLPSGCSNWNYAKTNVLWENSGAYFTGSTTGMTGTTGSTGTTGTTGMTGVTTTSIILASQNFPKGNEDVLMDITSYINNILYSGFTDYGLGLKMPTVIEKTPTLKRRSVAFHVKNTNTYFEPYIETIIDDTISDDRNFFYMDKSNDLYLYSNIDNISISAVTINDFNGKVFIVIPASGVTKVKAGIYKISLTIPSALYPDAVIFNDIWTIIQNGLVKNISKDFYLISSESFYNFDLSNRLNPDNFHFSFFGIKSGELIKRGSRRRIDINVKQLYKNQDSNYPLNLEYRLYIKQSNDVQIDVIPFTSVDRTIVGYEFIVDTSWLIPQDYYLELKISDGTVFSIKESIGFTIISDDAFTKS